MGVITRLAVETELSDRDGVLLTFVGKTPNAATGTTACYTGPIGFALQALGVEPLTPGSVTDSDLLNLDASRFYALCDIAEFRLIKTCLMSYTSTDEQSLDRRQAWNEMALRFTSTMNALQRQYAAYLNIRENPTMVGTACTPPPVPWRSEWGVPRAPWTPTISTRLPY